jgi:hypothetical protein
VAGKEQIMTAIYDMDPSTSTIATAWASSEFGDPETGPTEFWEALEADEVADRKPRSIARHAGLLAALAGVFCAGAAFGLAVFDFADLTPPTITLPVVSTQVGATPTETAPTVAAPVSESVSKPVAAVPDNAPSSKPSAPMPAPSPATAIAPTFAAEPGPLPVVSPPANVPGDAKSTVDLSIPAPPDAVPVPDDPEPPKPKTPNPVLQLTPEVDSTSLQPVQPPTLKKPRTTLYDPSSPNSKPKANPSTEPSQRTTLSKP